MKTLNTFVCFATAMLVAADLHSATVELQLLKYPDEPQRWELWAETSTGDNDGISGYFINLVEVESVEHLQVGVGLPGVAVLQGFRFHETNISGSVVELFGLQFAFPITSLIYDVGDPSATVPPPLVAGLENIDMPPVNKPFGPILLAFGTGARVDFDRSRGSAVNIWTEGQAAVNGFAAEAADVQLTVHLIPEPTAGSLFACTLLVALLARYR